MPGVIRRSVPIAPRAVSLSDLDQQGKTLIDAARRQAAAILALSKAEAETAAARLFDEARRKGEAEGRTVGESKARSESVEKALVEARGRIDSLTAALKDGVHRFEREKLALLAAAESRVIELALATARRVCKLEVGRSSDAALRNAAQLIEMMRHESDLEIALSPLDHESFEAASSAIAGELGLLKHVRIVADADLAQGDCRGRSSRCTIDATVDTQIARLATALLGEPTERILPGVRAHSAPASDPQQAADPRIPPASDASGPDDSAPENSEGGSGNG